MERLQELINQLNEQFERKVDPAQILQTIRLLDVELRLLASQPSAVPPKGPTKIAVMMPSSAKIYTAAPVPPASAPAQSSTAAPASAPTPVPAPALASTPAPAPAMAPVSAPAAAATSPA